MACVYVILVFLALAALPPHPARAMEYYPDPVYEKLNADDSHPMADIQDMARAGDPRAQFIIGDLYSKGKGGLEKNLNESRRWFEEAAMHGEPHAFIRLAALAKKDGKAVEAWQWYTLGIRALEGAEQKYVTSARAALADDKALSNDDLSAGRKAVTEWEHKRDKTLADEEKTAEEKKKTTEGENTATPKAQPQRTIAHQGGVRLND